jgi:HSP20 family protein
MSEKEIQTRKGGELERTEGREHPFYSLQRRINDLFEDFWGGFRFPEIAWPGMLAEGFTPKINITESDKGLHVMAELPGMEEKDIEVTLTDDGLTISGERKTEKEERGKTFVRREMSYGSFRRTIPVPGPVDASKVKATFKNGLLEIELPLPEAARRQVKKIEVKPG